MTECLIEAGAVLHGLGADGGFAIMTDAAIRVAGGKLAEIGPVAALRRAYPELPRFGGPGMIAMPGLVNSHHHSGITPLMHGVPFAPLEFWLPRFRALRSIPARLDTLYSAIEMLESGTTTVHHIAGGVAGSAADWHAASDAVIAAYGEIGMRVGYSFMIRDRNRVSYDDDAAVLAAVPSDVAEWLGAQLEAETAPVAELMGFYRELSARWRDRDPERVRLNLAPANLHWCTDAALTEIFGTAAATGAQVHMHLVETERQARFAHETTGHSAVQHLHELGCLGPNVTLGHGIWVEPDDLDLLAEHRCSVCHNASSGLRLGSGIAPVNAMLDRGLRVALGIDQSGINDDRDMLAEMKLVWALHRETGLFNRRATAPEILQMASEHGGRTAGFGDALGRLEVGKSADIVLLDRGKVERPVVDQRTPLADTVLLRAKSNAVEQVFVGGVLVVDGGRVTEIDREAVLAEIGERMSVLRTPAEQHADAMIERLLPMLQAEAAARETYRPYRYNRLGDESSFKRSVL